MGILYEICVYLLVCAYIILKRPSEDELTFFKRKDK
ncbi:unnamed protein product [Grapevine leafroll-associated virus 7]|uniref:Uncharacterized protein n=1 Tax=Grapevine leafroll-associated virus 7 TaxID=217615 RepID=G3CCC4_9CLOS|nr:unnamed protein product [Grapevine leafroll-associated virus 7]CCD33052.1 hypothetical protein [Grapevine leafroll-associated virus 7]